MTLASSPREPDGRHRPPLDQPHYRASFVEALRRFFVKYATFSGRAGRAEYWWVALVTFLLPFVFQGVTGVLTGDWRQVDGMSFTSVADGLLLVVYLATAVPTLALTWRRMHDVNRSGLWTLVILVPFLGWIAFLAFLLLGPRPEGARFDRPPIVTTY